MNESGVPPRSKIFKKNIFWFWRGVACLRARGFPLVLYENASRPPTRSRENKTVKTEIADL